jgi:hypothetical protein
MDRRNKKAAQIAANSGAGAGAGGLQTQRDRDRDRELGRERETAARGRKVGASELQGSGGTAPTRNASLLPFGSTAPTRIPPSGARPPISMTSKAAPAPAAPAPALKDTDFTSFDSFANAAKGIPSKPHPDASATTQPPKEDIYAQEMENNENSEFYPPSAQSQTSNNSNGGVASPPGTGATESSPFLATPTKPHRFTGRHASSNSVDFGPVGSPPHSSPGANPVRINGFSPATSPRSGGVATGEAAKGNNAAPGMTQTSTFSAPGPQNLFSQQNIEHIRGRPGPAPNAGVGQTSFTVGSLPVLSSMTTDTQSFRSFAETFHEEEMEDFVPSSLSDLLTPEEQSRRMSRTSSSNPGINGMATSVVRPGVQQQTQQDNRHRHSRSVPGTSMLSQDLRSIWGDSGNDQPDPNAGFNIGVSPSSGAFGTPSSFTSNSVLGKDGPSPSMLHPSNASAAFLGLHHYMGRDTPQRMSTIRASSQGHIQPQDMARAPSTSSTLVNGKEATLGMGGVIPSVSSSLLTTGRPAFDLYQPSPPMHHRGPTGAPPSSIGRGADHLGLGAPPSLVSPSARALQAHAPGQSLPQGLAAGYSRIHLQPAAAFSPGSNGGMSDVGSGFSPGSTHDWASGTPGRQQNFYHPDQSHVQTLQVPTSPPANTNPSHQAAVGTVSGATTTSLGGLGQQQDDLGGLTSMFSHLSYSSVAATGLRMPSSGQPHATGPGSMGGPPPGLSMPVGSGQNGPAGSAAAPGPLAVSRRSSARGWGSHPLSSPLSGPVLTNDDDDLFAMDEEK